jgi:DNA-binding transcriptional LysR family regulator
MNIEELKAVLDACRFRNYAEAAQYASLSPSVISRYIAKVESELGIVIFERATKTKSIELTPAGRTVLKDIKNLVDSYSSLVATAQAVNSDELPPLRVGYYPTIDSFDIEHLLADFIHSNPSMSVRLLSGGASKLLSCLMSNVADALLLPLSEWDFEPSSSMTGKLFNPDIEMVELGRYNNLYFLMSTRHELAKRQKITKEDIPAIQKSTLLINSRSTYNPDYLQRAFSVFGSSTEEFKIISMDMNNPSIILSMVQNHDDVIVPLCLYKTLHINECVLVPVSDWNVNNYYFFIYRKSNSSRSLRRLRKTIMNIFSS